MIWLIEAVVEVDRGGMSDVGCQQPRQKGSQVVFNFSAYLGSIHPTARKLELVDAEGIQSGDQSC